MLDMLDVGVKHKSGIYHKDDMENLEFRYFTKIIEFLIFREGVKMTTSNFSQIGLIFVMESL